MYLNLKSIAKELNISVSTVSRVVNSKDNVNEETRKRVLELLEKYNYIPNQIARSLKNKTSNTVGIIIPDITESFFTQVIKGVEQILTKNGYSLIFSDSDESPVKEKSYMEFMFQKRVDALVLATVSKDTEPVNMYIQNNIPVIFIDNLPNLVESFDAVVINNAKASTLAVQHLIYKGHKRIAIITGRQDETTGYERLNGYTRTLSVNSIEIDQSLIKYGNYKDDSGYACMKELLDNKKNSDFTAVYVTSEKMTFGAIAAIREAKLSIPDDISVVAFDFHDRSGLIVPGITSIIQPEREIGSLVADLIIKRIQEKQEKANKKQGHGTAKQVILIEPALDVKDSCKVIK